MSLEICFVYLYKHKVLCLNTTAITLSFYAEFSFESELLDGLHIFQYANLKYILAAHCILKALLLTVSLEMWREFNFQMRRRLLYICKYLQCYASKIYNNLVIMKFTHNAVTSIMVQKVENITTSMTRAGLGDDTYRRQRQKQRYLKCKQQQAEKQQKMREQFLSKRNQKIKEAEVLTQKRHAKRQKKKERQRQLKKKMKFIQKLDKANHNVQDGQASDNQQVSSENEKSQQIEQCNKEVEVELQAQQKQKNDE